MTYAQATESIDAALHRADELMYEVKRAGRNDIRFTAVLGPKPPAVQLRARGP